MRKVLSDVAFTARGRRYAFFLAVVQLSPQLKLTFSRICLEIYEHLGSN